MNRPADQNFRRGKKWTFMLSQFLEWTFMSDQICRMKKKWKKKKKKWTFSFFFHFFSFWKFIFFWSPKKVHSEILPTSKVHFLFIPENVRSKSLFFVYLLVSKFQVQIPYPKPALNPKSLGFRILVFGWFKLSQVKLSNQPQQILARFPFATNETIVKIYI